VTDNFGQSSQPFFSLFQTDTSWIQTSILHVEPSSWLNYELTNHWIYWDALPKCPLGEPMVYKQCLL